MSAEPSGDLYALWVAVHDYLIAQARTGLGEAPVTELGQAYGALVDKHNELHAAYFYVLDEPREIAGA